MKRPQDSDGFVRGFALMLLWSWPLGLASLALWAGSLLLPIPALLWRVATLAWLLPALARAALVKWGSEVSSKKDPPKENKNPYSAKSEKPPVKEEPAPMPVPSPVEEAALADTLDRLEDQLRPAAELHVQTEGRTAQQGG